MRIEGRNGDTFEITLNGTPFEGQLMELVIACCVNDGYEDIVIISADEKGESIVRSLAFTDDPQLAERMTHALTESLPEYEVKLYTHTDDDMEEQKTDLN